MRRLHDATAKSVSHVSDCVSKRNYASEPTCDTSFMFHYVFSLSFFWLSN
jgi:hypothetical protein